MTIKALTSTLALLCLAGQILAAADLNPAALAPRHAARPVRYVTRPLLPKLDALATPASNAAVAALPLWQGGTAPFRYQMVGADPTAAGSGTTTIPANVIPVILTFADGNTFDPTVAGACSTQGSPQSLVLSSPLFNNSAFSAGGVDSGSTQYLDFYQRANFWQYTGPNGVSPNYHVLLMAQPSAAINITVPSASGRTVAAGCGRLGEMDINWFDNYLLSTVFPQLAAAGVMPSGLPTFILYNTVMYDTTASNCCILGYHSAFNNASFAGALQTYAVSDFDTSGDFGTTQNTASLSHEVGEWMDDPTGNNPTPSWGHTGQVTGCQTNLENGDPLSGTDITIPMPNAYNYHVQELVFKSWFLRDSPSTGVNGWYSSNGTFTTASTPCNSSVTTMTITPVSIAAGSSANVSVAVKAAAGSSGTPSGPVSLIASNTQATVGTLTLSGGNATGSINFPAGSYSVTAKYAGDANFTGSSSAPVAITVGSVSVALSPASLTFPSQNTGTAGAAQNVTLTNQGTAPLTISSISFTGANPGDFSHAGNCGTTLAAGAACTIAVTFTPTAAGTRTASLSVADNVSGSPQTLPVSGTGVAAGGPKVSLSASSLTFPATAVGVSSAAQSVTITNSGNATLTGIATSVGGANASDFGRGTSCGSSLAAGSSCSVTITFTPTSAGTRGATLSIADNATGSPQTVSLSGTGTSTGAAAISLSATSLTYGNSVVGNSTAYQAVTLSNTSSAAVSGIGLSLGGVNAGDFGGTTNCTGSLAVNASCSVSLRFTPAATGPRTGSLNIVSSGAGSPQTVALTGTGAGPSSGPAVTVSVASLSFPSTAVGTSSGSQSMTITNTGTATLTGIGLSLTGANGGDWGGSTTCGRSLAVNAGCSVTLSFNPRATGARTGSLTIASNAATSPNNVALSGTGR